MAKRTRLSFIFPKRNFFFCFLSLLLASDAFFFNLRGACTAYSHLSFSFVFFFSLGDTVARLLYFKSNLFVTLFQPDTVVKPKPNKTKK